MIDDELEPLLDIVSYGRALAERGRPLSIGQIKLITRTVGRSPEVMVKVVNKGSSSLAGVGGHVGYIGRQGAVELETDEGEVLQGPEVGKTLLEDWNLDLIQQRNKINLTPTSQSSRRDWSTNSYSRCLLVRRTRRSTRRCGISPERSLRSSIAM